LCIYQENTSDLWDIPLYTWKHYITSIYTLYTSLQILYLNTINTVFIQQFLFPPSQTPAQVLLYWGGMELKAGQLSILHMPMSLCLCYGHPQYRYAYVCAYVVLKTSLSLYIESISWVPQVPSTGIWIFLNPQLFLSLFKNFLVHT